MKPEYLVLGILAAGAAYWWTRPAEQSVAAPTEPEPNPTPGEPTLADLAAAMGLPAPPPWVRTPNDLRVYAEQQARKAGILPRANTRPRAR